MSQEYLLTRKAALLARADATDPDVEKTIGQLAAVSLAAGSSGGGGGSTDVSTLATEVTATAIKNKLPSLSSGNIPVVVAEKILTPDKRTLTANTVIPEGSIYVYMKVNLGDITIDGLTYSTGEFINYESCYPCKHPEITITIPAGKSVRLDRGY